ncbi:MAG TPA: FAD-dependent oxidoreductase [Candidatus Binatia bacterium]|nr:FAD-dependent oxidoreductase [Candidatus Binatia bacterium]
MEKASDRSDILILGGGQAGAEIAMNLRQRGFAGSITLAGDEPQPPYKRPPLSKGYLSGQAKVESLHVMPPDKLAQAGIRWLGSARAARLDRVARQVELADGRRLSYRKLALATGGRPRALPGVQGDNVFLLRTIADVDAIRARCAPGARVVIVGAGFIGLEAAAVLVKLGLKVTVLEALPRVLARVTVPEMSQFYEAAHRAAGVDLRTSARIAGFDGTPAVSGVRLEGGETVAADLIIVGIGIVPNVELAQQAALAVDNGIVVDECARTGDPDVVAAGDCTSHPSVHYGRRVRLESVQNAMEQARTAAASLMGLSEPYQAVPWFWSDQYDLKLQMAGLSTGFDRMVMRGDPAKRSFALFYLGDGKLVAADAVNRAQDYMFARKAIAARTPLDAAKLADESVSLKDLVPPGAA